MASSFVIDFALVLIIGLAVSLVMSEAFGVSPGGIITPAYLAMTLDDPQVVIIICVIALASYLIVQYGFSRVVMIYGRRKFIAFMLVAVTMKLIMDYCFPLVPFGSLEFRGIGLIVPALIANQISKQGPVLTFGMAGAATFIVFLIMNAFYFLGL